MGMKIYAMEMSSKLGYDGDLDGEILEIAQQKLNIEYAIRHKIGTHAQRALSVMKLAKRIHAKRILSPDAIYKFDNRYELQCQSCAELYKHQDGDIHCLEGNDIDLIEVCMDWERGKPTEKQIAIFTEAYRGVN